MRFMACVEITAIPDGVLRSELLVKLGKALDHSTAREALSEALGCEVHLETAEDAVSGFFDAIELTGGVTKEKKGWYVPLADREWIDLGEAYVDACAAFDWEPKIVREEDVDES